MLILSRNLLETVMIGDDIKIIILSANGGSVRLGIEAPRDVSVHRTEVYLKINRNKNNKSNEKKFECGTGSQ